MSSVGRKCIDCGEVDTAKFPTRTMASGNLYQEPRCWKCRYKHEKKTRINLTEFTKPKLFDPDWRLCLGEYCGKTFWSASIENRLCKKCIVETGDEY